MTRQSIAHHIATVFGLGDLVLAPGTTAGSFPAALLWWAVMVAVHDSMWRIAVTTIGVLLFTAIGIWAGDLESRRRGTEDPGPVVIDEVAGQWLTYLVALPFLSLEGLWTQTLVVAVGFLSFRFFDIVKPWPANRFEKLPGGVGIMADDLAAAVYSGICLAFAARWFI